MLGGITSFLNGHGARHQPIALSEVPQSMRRRRNMWARSITRLKHDRLVILNTNFGNFRRSRRANPGSANGIKEGSLHKGGTTMVKHVITANIKPNMSPSGNGIFNLL